MATPTFRGQLLGRNCRLVTLDRNPDGTRSTFGESNLEWVPSGHRHRRSVVTGQVIGQGMGGLGLQIQALRALNDGRADTLTDTLGAAWSQVLCGPLQLVGGIAQANDGSLVQQFRIEFTHLL